MIKKKNLLLLPLQSLQLGRFRIFAEGTLLLSLVNSLPSELLGQFAPLSGVFRLLLSRGLTIVTGFFMIPVFLCQQSDVVNPARSLLFESDQET